MKQTIFYNKDRGKWLDKWGYERTPEEALKEQNDIDEVHVVYNRFKTLASQELMMEKVLPVDFTTDYNAKDYNYDYEPGQKEIVSTLIRLT